MGSSHIQTENKLLVRILIAVPKNLDDPRFDFLGLTNGSFDTRKDERADILSRYSIFTINELNQGAKSMTITRVGSSEKYATGWELAFGKGKSKKSATAVATRPKKKPTTKATKASAKPAMASSKTKPKKR